MSDLPYYFRFPHKEGYTRYYDEEEDKCYYIPRKQFLQLLLDDINESMSRRRS